MRKLLAIAAALAALNGTALAQSFPPGGVYTRTAYASGTISNGGTAQSVGFTLPAAKMRCVENPGSATEDLYVAFGATASTSSQDLVAGTGAQVCWPWAGPVSVYAATTGHAYIAVEAQ